MTLRPNSILCEITQWVNEAFKSENYLKYDIEIEGSSAVGDGYVGDITFLKVTAFKSDKDKLEYSLVLKHGKKNDDLRKNAPVRQAFEREIFIYSKVVSTFQHFQKCKNLTPIDFMPRCFKTLLYERDEIIVFENLKSKGYDLHDRYTTMDMKHMKLSLEAYAKWHALSFAYKDQEPGKFRDLSTNLECIFKAFLSKPQFGNVVNIAEKAMYEILQENEQSESLSKLKQIINGAFLDRTLHFLNIVEPQSVFIHGDCWNNNMMFLYKECDVDKKNPERIALLDFQTSRLASPVYDLSYHIYAVASKEELKEDLLKIYYTFLSDYLRELGSDPDTVFSYADLLNHWKKYSAMGLICASFALPFALAVVEDAIDIQDMTETPFLQSVQSIRKHHYEEYSSRLIAMTNHFLKTNETN